jgi:hypothetical protein
MLAYLSYLCGELLGISGIVSLFCCGVVTSHYVSSVPLAFYLSLELLPMSGIDICPNAWSVYCLCKALLVPTSPVNGHQRAGLALAESCRFF